MRARASRLFVGIGNVLRHDDGIGVYAAQRLAARPQSSDVEVFEAGTATALAAGALDGRDFVVVADAIDRGAEPGAIFRLRPAQLRPFVHTGLSLHDVHLLDALDESRLLGRAPRRVVVLAVQVADVSAGIGLSPAVGRSLGRLVELAWRELGRGVEMEFEVARSSKGGVPCNYRDGSFWKRGRSRS